MTGINKGRSRQLKNCVDKLDITKKQASRLGVPPYKRLSDELKGLGWNILSISLQFLLLERLKKEDRRVIDSIIRTERRFHERNPDRALNHLKDKIAPHIEGADGIAKDVIALIDEFADKHHADINRTVIFVGRKGALYPRLMELRDTALLKLQKAEQEANDTLDNVLSQDEQEQVQVVQLALIESLRNCEVSTAQEVEALVNELRDRLLAQLRENTRIRII